jgi:hypothetical protein
MPYEISFTRPVAITDREQYINECCVGGDAVVDALLPAVRDRYQDLDTNQEDWGWFIWFKKGDIRLAVDVHTDDGDAGEFRVMLTSSRKRLFRFEEVDTPELEELRVLIEDELRKWQVTNVAVSKSD